MFINENNVITAIIQEIKDQLVSQGFSLSDLRVARSNQPTSQHIGATNGAKRYQVLLTPITNSKINMSRVSKVVDDELNANYIHTKGVTYQIECLTEFDPSNSDSIDARTLCELVSELLQHFDAIYNLKSKGVNVQSSGDVRPSYTIMDTEQFESTPSFDFKVNYNALFTKVSPSTDQVTGTITGV